MDDYLAYTQKDLDEAYIEDLREDLEEQKKTNEDLVKQVQSLTNTINTLVESITASSSEISDLKARLEKYESVE